MKKIDLLNALKDLPDDAQVVVGAVFEKQESFEIGQDDAEASIEDNDEDVGAPIDNGDGTMTDFLDIQDVMIIDDVEEMEDGTEVPTKFVSLTVDMTEDDEDDDEEEDGEADGSDD